MIVVYFQDDEDVTIAAVVEDEDLEEWERVQREKREALPRGLLGAPMSDPPFKYEDSLRWTVDDPKRENWSHIYKAECRLADDGKSYDFHTTSFPMEDKGQIDEILHRKEGVGDVTLGYSLVCEEEAKKMAEDRLVYIRKERYTKANREAAAAEVERRKRLGIIY